MKLSGCVIRGQHVEIWCSGAEVGASGDDSDITVPPMGWPSGRGASPGRRKMRVSRNQSARHCTPRRFDHQEEVVESLRQLLPQGCACLAGGEKFDERSACPLAKKG